jgi:hypothetical protein
VIKYIPLLLIFIGCANKQEKPVSNTDTGVVDSEPIITSTTISVDGTMEQVMNKLEDTIQFFAHKKEFVIEDENKLFYLKGFSIKGQQFAVIIYQDYLINSYKLNEGHCVKIFSDKFDGGIIAKVVLEDINFDGINDLLIAVGQGAHGNAFSTVFLYDDLNKTLKRTKYLDLVNIEIDKENKLLRSQWFTSVCGNPGKELYRLTKDSIELMGKTWVESTCNNETLKYPVIHWYNYKNNRITDSLVKETENAWNIYLKALWDNSKDYD